MRQQGTDPNIIRAIVLALPRWRADSLTTAFCPYTISQHVQKAIQSQHRIGWDNMMTGLLSTQWAICQDMYYKTKKRRRTGKRWAIQLSRKLWDYHRAQWKHRNSVRYRLQNQDTLHGRAELLYACQLELDFGLMDLDEIFKPYFDRDIESLEEENTTFIKSWFSTIRRAREESGYFYHNHDRISDSLRKWVGLSMEKKFRKE